MTSLSSLFSPIRIGQITVKNRLVMPAMSVNFGVDKDGFVNDQLTEYFVARAKGGTGMLIVGGGGIDPIGHELPELPALWDKNCIPSLKRMTKKVKAFGVKLGMQIMHGGRQTYKYEKEAPSPIAAPALVKGIPKKLRINRIHQLVKAFGVAAEYCKEGGFDFVEIHAGHGYLINQFMSQNANHRTDEYGGSYQNRIKFIIEVLEEVKRKTLYNFPVGIRLNGADYIENGWILANSIDLAPILESRGADYLSISAGVYGSSQLTIPSMYVKQGCFVDLASSIKKKVSIPVITVGRIRDPEFADYQIKIGNADMVAMGRSHLADPDIAKKAEHGNLASIRPCIGCCVGCIDRVLALESATCAVNPDVGREYQLAFNHRTSIPKKLLVIGAGLAGLSIARKASLRGHNVIVLDKASFVGGTANFAAIPPGRHDIIDIISFLESELHKLNVEIRLNVRLTRNIINEIMPEPDEVIIATGALFEFPIIRGLSKTSMNLYNPMDILLKKVVINDNAIILGGNQAGLVLADFLSSKGKKITVLHRKNHFAEDMARNDRFYLRERLKKNKVMLHKKVRIVEVSNTEVVFSHENNQEKITGLRDFIIAEKTVSIKKVRKLLDNTSHKTHVIGDSNMPGNILQSIRDGNQLGDLI